MRTFMFTITIIIIVFLTSFCIENGHCDETDIGEANRGTSVNSTASNGGIAPGLGQLQGGVNLFSGDLGLSLPILNLPGRNGLNTAVTLTYLSNVHLLMNSENRYAQTSWVGAGWNLGFGSIYAELNGTKSLNDDVYYLVSPQGSRAEIIKDADGSYQLENDPYTKIEADISTNGKIRGWTLRDISGMVYKYGDFTEGFGSNLANRCIRHWGEWVGNGVVDGEANICNQWDLSEITDITGGNKVEFYYFQEQDLPVVSPADPTPTYYTRASYIDYIIDAVGRKIDFVLGDRTTDEYKSTKLGFQVDQYETKFLDKIEIYETETALTALATHDFVYQLTGSGDKTKRQLSEIVQYNEQSNSLPGFKFDYAGSSEDNAGALKTVTYPSGGKKQIKYKTQQNLSYLLQNIVHTGGASQFEEIFFRSSGNTAAYTDKTGGKLFIIKWVGKWISQSFSGLDINDNTRLAVSDNHVALFLKESSQWTLRVYDWDKSTNSWSAQILSQQAQAREGDVAVGESVLGIYVDDGFVRSWKWNAGDREWESSGSYEITYFGTNDWPAVINVSNNAILVQHQISNKRIVHVWNGSGWTESNYVNYPDGNYAFYLYSSLKDEYFADFDRETGELNLFYFDGVSSKFSGLTDYNAVGRAAGRFSYAVFSSSHILVCEFKGGGGAPWPFVANFYVWDRRESGWSSNHTLLKTVTLAQNETEYSSYDFTVNCSLNDNFIAVMKRSASSGHPAEEGPIWTWQWNPQTLSWGTESELVNSRYLASTDVEFEKVDFALIGNRIVVHRPGRTDAPPLPSLTEVWDWNGTAWAGPTTVLSEYALITNNRYELFGGYNYVGTYRVKTGDIKAAVVHGLNSWSTSVIDYPVDYITENDGYNTESIKTSYDFSSNAVAYDQFINFAGYETAKTIPEGNFGYVEQTFNEEIDDSDVRDRGLPVEIKHFKENTTTNPITTRINNFSIYQHTGNAYQVRLDNMQSTVDGVINSVTYQYNDLNGMVDKTTGTGNNANRITEIKYAFEQTAYKGTAGGGANGTYGMDDLNMLSQVARQTVYEGSIAAGNERVASATTWKHNWTGTNGEWAPQSAYSWLESSVGSYSMPTFNFDSPPGNSEWIKGSEALTRDQYGNAIEVQDALGTVISTKYGYDASRPVATFVNAATSQNVLGSESGYIGFESNDETDGIADNDYWLFDVRNNFSSDAYAGLYSRKVEAISGTNKYGPTRDFQPPTNGQDRVYIASCWVKTTAGSNQVSLVFQDKTGTSNNSVSFYETDYAAGTGSWEYLEGEIDMSQTTAEKLRVFIVNESSTHVLVDEIRVHPKDAISTSQSYDKFGAIITSVDANSIRTQLEYDEFNRPINVKNTDDDLLAQTTYYLTTDFNIAPNSVTNNVYTGSQTLTGVAYSDGLGRSIQNQIQDGPQRIVQQSVYDQAGRMRVATKPAFVSGALAYDDNFLPAGWTIGSQMTSGNLHTYYSASGAGPDAGGYPFAQVDLKADPLGRPDKAGNPGSLYRIGSGNEVEITFGTNGASEVTGYAANTLFKTTQTDEENKIVETFRDKFGNTVCVKAPENAVTYYEYDILGNLLKVTPPLSSAGSYTSEFQYNTLGQLVAKVTPDLDGDWDNDPTDETLITTPDMKYKYDSNGNLRFVQDPIRKSGGDDLFFYKYDALGRLTTLGVATTDADIPSWTALDPDIIYDGGSGENFENESLHQNYLRQKNAYDAEPAYGSGVWADAVDPGALNYIKGRLVATAYYDLATGKWGYTYYSYDKFGSLERMIQDLPGTELGIKTIDYEYDRLGRQTVKKYQDGQIDAFYYWYDYDAAGRLYKIFASKTDDKPTAKTVSQYSYWPTGQVKTMTYANGHTMDYTFTERDWLSALDMPNIFELDLDFDKVGNIDYMSQKIDSDRNGSLTNNSDYGYNFGYDNLYRLLSAANTNGVQTDAGYKYDLNGNILGLNRGSSAVPATTYNYTTGSNRLDNISSLGQSAGNYLYDYNGSLLRDAKKGITTDIANDYRNLPYRILINTNKFDMSYDATGSRVIKKYVTQ